MRSAFIWFLIAITFPGWTAAQKPDRAQLTNAAADLWRIRSEAITEDLITDSKGVSPPEQALLWAKLATAWWRSNPEKARSWLHKAIDIVEHVPNRENPSERSARLSAARSLIAMMGPLDAELAKQLTAFLDEDSSNADSATQNADGLVEAAIVLIDKDPQRAAEMGARALKVGRPTQIASLLFPLRRKSPGLGDELFIEAIRTGHQSLDESLLNSLAFFAFPAERQIRGDTSPPPDELRRQLLELDLVFLQANPINPANKNPFCASVIAFIAPVLGQFDRLLPQQGVTARQFVNQCLTGGDPALRQQIDEAMKPEAVNNVDALLKAADDAQDPKRRAIYQMRAALLAKESKDVERALNILDSIDKDGREFIHDAWEAYRWQWASVAAIDRFNHDDLDSMRAFIKAVPADLRPFAEMEFINDLPTARIKTFDPRIEFLEDAHAGLRRMNPSEERATAYLALLPLCIRLMPAQSSAVLKEAIAALNAAQEASQKDQSKSQSTVGPPASKIPSVIATSLLDMNESEVRDAISSISSVAMREEIRLELLTGCLARMSRPTAA